MGPLRKGNSMQATEMEPHGLALATAEYSLENLPRTPWRESVDESQLRGPRFNHDATHPRLNQLLLLMWHATTGR